jgi:ribonucleoside-diphosphate reductase alpha chain
MSLRMSDHIYVTTRSGRKEPVSFDKVLNRIQALATGLDHVNPDLVAQKVCSQIADGIKTSDLDEFAAETCAMMQARNHPNYGRLAARLLIDNHQKNTPATFYETMETLEAEGVVSEEFTNVAISRPVEGWIDYQRDFLFDYFGFKTLLNGYLLRNRAGKVLERPQHLWMRVAIQLHGTDDEKIRETYDALSQGYFIHATPTLFNAGTNHPQLSSCFLVQMEDDSISGIYNTLGECAQISKWAGGIGLSIHNIRAKDSAIKGTNGKSTGIVPMLKVFNDTAKYVNQGGKRNGSFAIYMEPWHADIEDFLRLKLNTGTEEERARDLFYGLWIPDLFMKRVEEDGMWSLMCPNECPRLSDVWGEQFEALYAFYEEKKMYRKQVPAKKLWQAILDAQIQTGTPYLCYKDAANRKSNQQNLGTIKSSNLCTEIIEYTSPDETAVCNLGSLALPRFVETQTDGSKTYNFERLRKYTTVLTRNLNKVIDINFYPTDKCRRSNMAHRPIGIGVQGLADVFAMLRLPWTSDAAAKLNREIFENIYYAAVAESVDQSILANPVDQWRGIDVEVPRRGAYATFEGSPASRGKLQYDLWEQEPTQTPYLDWAYLKEKVARYGMRNSLLVAPMPTASTSQILGNNECIEPFTSNMYSRRVLSGEFVVINKYLVDDLVRRNLWTPDIRSQIIANNGSIQSIIELPSELRDLYKTSWEIPMKTLINLAADRAPFICQSQSLNLFVAEPSYSKLSSMHVYAWKKGLKTGCYYLRTKAVAKAQQFTVEPPACVTCSA